MINKQDITAMILAGGRGTRMGGRDKGLVPLGNRPMIAHVLQAIRPQVGNLIINANRNLSRYADFGFPVISDELEGFQGPLAGILAGLQSVPTPWMLCIPCDVPGIPHDLVARLILAQEEQQADMAVVHDGDRLQPAFALIPTTLTRDLETCLNRGERQLRQWCMSHHPALADYSDAPQHFININDHKELEHIQASAPDPL
ncbi:molybdenum cofactor guanylyltransferase MobA [Thiolapillus brandeum]|uniref:Molybdenum cofactor guanylyltransferase n=1 Tax=Thiolapillus brandeum TaxID=1076588 RepID=A0A7U6GJX1_9GAMM|nr:molybdenum cofactor guanylyltransferase MobA [Thiolapillus brandeum]BAO44945.1 molybdopterin-guanine dinucleotide biosynthesis protein A [Thiolapillus brandeum]